MRSKIAPSIYRKSISLCKRIYFIHQQSHQNESKMCSSISIIPHHHYFHDHHRRGWSHQNSFPTLSYLFLDAFLNHRNSTELTNVKPHHLWWRQCHEECSFSWLSSINASSLLLHFILLISHCQLPRSKVLRCSFPFSLLPYDSFTFVEVWLSSTLTLFFFRMK